MKLIINSKVDYDTQINLISQEGVSVHTVELFANGSAEIDLKQKNIDIVFGRINVSNLEKIVSSFLMTIMNILAFYFGVNDDETGIDHPFKSNVRFLKLCIDASYAETPVVEIDYKEEDAFIFYKLDMGAVVKKTEGVNVEYLFDEKRYFEIYNEWEKHTFACMVPAYILVIAMAIAIHKSTFGLLLMMALFLLLIVRTGQLFISNKSKVQKMYKSIKEFCKQYQ